MVLIVGAGGQLGQALAETRPDGVTLAALSRTDLDIADGDAVRQAIMRLKPAWVINCAAYTAVDRAETELEAARRINGDAVGILAEACSAAGARLVQVSTDFVFNGDRSTPYRPDDLPDPVNAYGRTKLAGENAALAVSGNLLVRTAWVYGQHGPNFVKTMLRLMGERDEVRVVADQVGTPSHARALARTIWSLIANGASGIFHATDAGVASWYDFAVAIQEEALALGLLDRSVPIVPIATADYPTPARRPAFSVLDKSATWSLLGEPAAHWRKELRQMLADLKEQKNG